MRANCVALLAAALLACVGGPPPVAGDHAAVWGRLQLVPREGAQVDGSQGYGDRRMRNVERVDYSRPGFAVMYVDQDVVLGGRIDLSVVEGVRGPRLEPEYGAIGRGGEIVVVNRGASVHVISIPAAGLIQPLAPTESLRIEAAAAGELDVHVVDARAPGTTVFVAPGPWAVVDSGGNYQLTELEPGPASLRAWHPRFPPVVREIELVAGTALRADIEVGVGLSSSVTDAP